MIGLEMLSWMAIGLLVAVVRIYAFRAPNRGAAVVSALLGAILGGILGTAFGRGPASLAGYHVLGALLAAMGAVIAAVLEWRYLQRPSRPEAQA